MSDIKFGLQLELKGDQVVIRGLDGTRTAVSNLDESVSKNTRSSQTATQANHALAASMGNISSQARALSSVLAAMGVYLSADQLISYSDASKQVNNQLRQVTTSEEALVEVRAQLVAISKHTNAELDVTVGLYSELFRATRELGTAQSDVAGVTETINNLFKAGGRSAAETAGAVRQLTQGFAAGVLRGDEFNSVAEGAPRILDAIAKYTGIARGELRDFAAEGGITSEILVNSLKEYQKEARRLAGLTEETFGQKMVNARTNLIVYAESMHTANAAIDTFGSGLESLSANMDVVIDLATVAGSVLLARYAGPALAAITTATSAEAAYTSQLLRGNVVTVNSAAAEKGRAAASLQKAQAQRAATLADVAGYTATLNSVRAELELEAVRLRAQISDRGRQLSVQRMAALRLELASATSALARVEAAHATAVAAETAALTRYNAAAAGATVANRALTASSRALSGTVALLGGPAGIAILAAAGVMAFREELGLTAKPVENITANIGKLREEFSGFTAEQVTQHLVLFRAELLELEKASIEANARMQAELADESLWERLNPLNKTNNIDAINRATEATKKFGAQQQRVLELENLLADLRNPNRRSGGAADDIAESTKALLEKITLTRDENALLRQGYDLEQAKFDAAYAHADELTRRYMDLQREQKAILDLHKEEADMLQALSDNNDQNLQDQIDKRKALADSVQDFLNTDFNSNAFEAFDELGRSLYGVADALDELSDRQEAFNKLKAEEGLTANEVRKINAKQTQSQISAYGDITGAAKSYFDESSKGYKALQAAEQVFRTFEIVMTGQALAAKLLATETASAAQAASVGPFVANETVKAQAAGATAVAVQGQGDPYSAFPRMAAMIALLAGIGIVLGGSGGGSGTGISESKRRQDAQGTGTVLGDAKADSESIANATELMADHLGDMLGINTGMLQELRTLNGNIAGLGNLLGRKLDFDAGLLSVNTGTTIGGAGNAFYDLTGGSALSVMTGGGLGLGFSFIDDMASDVAGFIDDALGGALSSVASSISSKKVSKVDEGIELLGSDLASLLELGVVDALAYARIRTKKKKWGNTKTSYSTKTEELGDEISSQFGQILGSIYESVFASIDITGVGNADAIGDFTGLKISTKGLSPEDAQKEIEAVLSAFADEIAETVMPGIVEFQNVGEGAFETLARLTTQTVIFRDAAEALGLSLSSEAGAISTGISSFVDKLFGRDSSNKTVRRNWTDAEILAIADSLSEAAGGLEEFAGNVSSFMDTVLTDSEKFTRLENQVGEMFASLNSSVPTSREALADYIASLDLSTQAHRDAFTAITGASDALDDFYSQLEDIASQAYGFDTALGLEDGTKPLRDALADVGLNFDIVETAASRGVESLQALFVGLTDVQKAGLEPFADEIRALAPDLEDLTAVAERLREFAAGAQRDLLSPGQQLDSLQAEYSNLINAALNGNLQRVDDITSIGQQLIQGAANSASSELEYKRLVAQVTNSALSVADVLDPTVDIAEQQLNVLIDIRNELGARGAGPIGAFSYSTGTDTTNQVVARLQSLDDRLKTIAADQKVAQATIASHTGEIRKMMRGWDDGDAMNTREAAL